MAITFLHQWHNAEGKLRAIPHMTTKNESFLRTCQLLRRMGIKNYAFPLTLYDPDLAHVDVHALEEDTEENRNLRIKVQIEARINTWYYLRECLRIYEQGGTPVPFRLDRGSCAMTWCWLSGLDYASMQPRQTGKAQPRTSKILTTQGWISLGEVTLDTKVICPDRRIASVVAIHPQGLKDTYRITLSDGRSTESCDEHLWKVDLDGDKVSDIFQLKDMAPFFQNVKIPVVNFDRRRIDKLSIASVEPVGYKDSVCIEIDHPEHLYITDDCIVTHNTVCALALTSSIMYSSGLEYVVGMMAKDNDLRQENVKRVKAFGDNLPSWWLVRDKFKDKFNAEEILYHQYRTHYQTFVAQKEKAAADKQGRGGSMPMVHWDEFEYIVNIGTSYPTMMSSGSTARENAKKNGKPHSNIITTTAGDPLTKPCQEAAKILDGAMPFHESLYDCKDMEQLHAVVETRSEQKMILGRFSHQQLGYTNEWLRERIKRGRLTKDQVERDFLNRRVSIADKPIIAKHVLAAINSSQREPEWIEIISDKFAICWYISRDAVKSQAFKERSIVVGCDSSEMVDRDATTLVGVDPRSLETVFTFHCTEGNLNKVGVMIAQLLIRYPKFLWIPENKSTGTTMIDTVSLSLRNNGHNPFLRIFNWVVNNRNDVEFAKYDLRDTSLLDTQVKRHFGYKTDKAKRDELYGSTLLDASERAQHKVRDMVLIQELNSLTVRNGRVDHAVGGHDDTVMAWLLAMWVILNGKHLDIYGIKPGTVLSLHINEDDIKMRANEERQAKIRQRIEELEKALKTQRDPSSRMIIEADLKLLETLVDRNMVPQPATADEFIRDPKRFIDQVAVQESKPKMDINQIQDAMRALIGR